MSIETTIIRPETSTVTLREKPSVEQQFEQAKQQAFDYGESDPAYHEVGVDAETAGRATKNRFGSTIWTDPKKLFNQDDW